MAVPGTEGYAERAPALLAQWAALSFEDCHGPVRHLIPSTPARILDVGAGAGADAAAFALMGHDVVAVEPVAELRLPAMIQHPSPTIQWRDDSLPALAGLAGETFDLVMVSAVLMHLDAPERREAMPRLAGLLRAGAVMILSLRHGPVPVGRRMFEVSADETVELAQVQGLALILRQEVASVQAGNRQAGVTWTRLAFRKPAGP